MLDILSLQGIIEKIAPWITIIVLSFLFWKVPVWNTTIEKSIEHIEENLDKLEKKYEKIHGMLFGAVGVQLVKRTSPSTLTDYGTEISEQIGAAEIANKYANKLLPETENLNAYQVQECCFKFCKPKLLNDLKESNLNQYELIHTIAFENGIEIDKITGVVGIILRDAILSISGTSHSDKDKHSP